METEATERLPQDEWMLQVQRPCVPVVVAAIAGNLVPNGPTCSQNDLLTQTVCCGIHDQPRPM